MKRISYFMKKHKNRILSVCCSLLLIPIFSFRSYAYDFFYNSVYPENMSCFLQSNVTLNSGSPIPNNRFFYEFANTSASGVNYLVATFYPTWDIAFNTDSFDYYVNIYMDSSSSDSFTFFPNKISVRRMTSSSYIDTQLNESLFNDFTGKSDSGDSKGFHILAKLPDDFNYSIRGFNIVDSSSGSVPSNLNFAVTIIQAQKDSTLDAVQKIVNAIDNQTDELGNRIDETNDLVENGTEETQDNVSDFTEVFEDFNTELDNLTEFDDDIMTQFNSANAAYTTELKKFTLNNNVLAASTWLPSSMQHI